MLQKQMSIRQFRLTKWSFLVHSTTGNAPYMHPSHDSILELWRTFPKMSNVALEIFLQTIDSVSPNSKVKVLATILFFIAHHYLSGRLLFSFVLFGSKPNLFVIHRILSSTMNKILPSVLFCKYWYTFESAANTWRFKSSLWNPYSSVRTGIFMTTYA